MKKLKRTHLILLLLSILPLAVGLVCFIIKYDSLPDQMGIHFGLDEKTQQSCFDVIDNKIFGIYPFVAGFGLIALLSLCSFFVPRVKPSQKLTEKGNTVFQQFVLFIIDLFRLIVSAYFTIWTYCIITQKPQAMFRLGGPLSWGLLVGILALPIGVIVIRRVFAKRSRDTA